MSARTRTMSKAETAPTRAGRGRPRNTAIEGAVLDAALTELGTKGYAGFSLAAVAAAAGTTRPAIYRRWPDKDALLVDAVARLADTAAPPLTGDALIDLVAELENFRHCITIAGALPLAGLMLSDGLDPDVREVYLQRIVAPRRARIRALLDGAVGSGLLASDADLDVATTMLTGSWYAHGVAGRRPPRDWAARTAELVWRACGGRVPARR